MRKGTRLCVYMCGLDVDMGLEKKKGFQKILDGHCRKETGLG